MPDFKSILPPNATPFELQMEQATAAERNLFSQVDTLKQLRSKRPHVFADYFAGEWGLAGFHGFFTDDHTFFNQTLPWLQMRGTAVAVKSALNWLNCHASLDVEHFYLHIALDRAYHGEWFAFNRCVRESIPLHLDYYRVFVGYDVRRGGYDQSRYDDCLYDADSGVLVDDVLISYGETQTQQTSARIGIAVAMTAITVMNSMQRWRDAWNHRTWQTNFRCGTNL